MVWKSVCFRLGMLLFSWIICGRSQAGFEDSNSYDDLYLDTVTHPTNSPLVVPKCAFKLTSARPTTEPATSPLALPKCAYKPRLNPTAVPTLTPYEPPSVEPTLLPTSPVICNNHPVVPEVTTSAPTIRPTPNGVVICPDRGRPTASPSWVYGALPTATPTWSVPGVPSLLPTAGQLTAAPTVTPTAALPTTAPTSATTALPSASPTPAVTALPPQNLSPPLSVAPSVLSFSSAASSSKVSFLFATPGSFGSSAVSLSAFIPAPSIPPTVDPTATPSAAPSTVPPTAPISVPTASPTAAAAFGSSFVSDGLSFDVSSFEFPTPAPPVAPSSAVPTASPSTAPTAVPSVASPAFSTPGSLSTLSFEVSNFVPSVPSTSTGFVSSIPRSVIPTAAPSVAPVGASLSSTILAPIDSFSGFSAQLSFSIVPVSTLVPTVLPTLQPTAKPTAVPSQSPAPVATAPPKVFSVSLSSARPQFSTSALVLSSSSFLSSGAVFSVDITTSTSVQAVALSSFSTEAPSAVFSLEAPPLSSPSSLDLSIPTNSGALSTQSPATPVTPHPTLSPTAAITSLPAQSFSIFSASNKLLLPMSSSADFVLTVPPTLQPAALPTQNPAISPSLAPTTVPSASPTVLDFSFEISASFLFSQFTSGDSGSVGSSGGALVIFADADGTDSKVTDSARSESTRNKETGISNHVGTKSAPSKLTESVEGSGAGVGTSSKQEDQLMPGLTAVRPQHLRTRSRVSP